MFVRIELIYTQSPSAQEIFKKTAELSEEKREEVNYLNEKWELKTSSLEAEISSLKGQIETFRDEKNELRSFHIEILRQREAERDAEVEVLREAFEKVQREKNELLSQPDYFSVCSVKTFPLPLGEWLPIEIEVGSRSQTILFVKKRVEGEWISFSFQSGRVRCFAGKKRIRFHEGDACIDLGEPPILRCGRKYKRLVLPKNTSFKFN